jgi:ketosteroid isomerase-like protein
MTNSDIIRSGYDAFRRGDLDGVLSTLDENIDWVTPGPSELRTAGHRRGREEVALFFQTLNEMLQFERFEPLEFIEQGDRIVVLGEDTVRVRATGRTVDYEWAHVFEMRDEKTIRFREYGDTAALVAELQAAQEIAR